jgi:hypothetical protein
MRNARLALPLLAALALAAPAHAWSPEGHKVVAGIAARHLTDAAKAQVRGLLGGEAEPAMMAAAGWADEQAAKRPETAAWHYVDIPIATPTYDPARDCPGGDCLVARTERAYRTLANPAHDKAARAEALKYLIHFVGDVHQPLRCGDDGNQRGTGVKVLMGDKPTNLNAVWETEIVAAMGGTPEQLVSRFMERITPAQRKEWTRGTVGAWCSESAARAATAAYDDLRGAATEDGRIVLAAEYPYDKRNIASDQLKKAGVRLAALLNQSLK